MSDTDIAWADGNVSFPSLATGTPAKPHALMDLLVFGQMLASEEPNCAGMTEKSMRCAQSWVLEFFSVLYGSLTQQPCLYSVISQVHSIFFTILSISDIIYLSFPLLILWLINTHGTLLNMTDSVKQIHLNDADEQDR